MTLVLKGGDVFSEGNIFRSDVLVDGELIAGIGNFQGDVIIDCSGKVILPGLIDAHVHFREPGQAHKEDWLTGSMASAAGGVTTVLDMPNNSPPIISQIDVENKKELAKKSLVNYGFYVGATAENVDVLNSVADVVGIKVYRGSSTGTLLLEKLSDFVRLMETTDKLVVVHAENEDLIKYFSSRYKETRMHHMMRDNLAAAVSTASSALTARRFNKRLHIAHLSTKEEVEVLRKLKTQNITCEVTPHHLFLNEQFFCSHGNHGKMNPPLRYELDRKELWRALNEGIIDIIATDHAPHTQDEKMRDFFDAPCGVPGVQTMLPLLLNEVNQGNLSIKEIARLCCENPAKIFNIKGRGSIKQGCFADLVVVDMSKEFIITDEAQFSRCAWTPFHGKKVKGLPVMTIVNGHVVYADGVFDDSVKGRLIA